jgi:uncharacterized membrane protein
VNEKRGYLWALVLCYLACWIPAIALTRSITNVAPAGMNRPLTGLEILPVTNIAVCILIYSFFTVTRWWKSTHQAQIFGMTLPVPTRWTAMAGLGSALLLITVPLSLTFPGVSIPFIQLLMRGDVLLIAPLVDKISGRKVHWYSWVAVVLVAVALVLTIQQRGGLRMPALCIFTIILYTVGYFLRLLVMTRISKSPDAAAQKRYFVEEQMVAYPTTLLVLGILVLIGSGRSSLQLRWGFAEIWGQPAVWNLLPLGGMTAALGVLAAFILLDKRENTFCVPLERSASVLGGIMAAYVLAWTHGLPQPTAAELIGVALLVVAIAILSWGSQLEKRRKSLVAGRAMVEAGEKP